MVQATTLSSAPSRSSGFLSLTVLGEWFIAHFEIVVLILCVIGYQYFEFQRSQQASLIVQDPQHNDFFFVDYFALDKSSDPKHRFIPLKVVDVKGDSVTFKIGNIAHSTAVSPRDHMKFDQAMQGNFYRQGTLTYNKNRLLNLFKSGVIYDAKRPKNIYMDGWIVLSLRELNSQ